MDPRDRFTDTVAAYEATRPDYPAALVDWIRDRCPRGRVVDVGSGTGIFSRQLAAAGLDVVGVEPNAGMRAAAEARGGARYVAGDAEHTGLPSRSADIAVGAQAFHWFDLERALPELERVAAGGLVVAAWNDRDDTGPDGGFTRAYDALLHEVSEDFRTVPRPGGTIERICVLRPQATVQEVPHLQELDLQGVIGRAWSSSYVVHGVSDRSAFDAALTRIVEEHAVDGRVRITYRTRWVWWPALPRGTPSPP